MIYGGDATHSGGTTYMSLWNAPIISCHPVAIFLYVSS
jgi:hypothetical protein